MPKIFWFIGNALAGFFDFCIGASIAAIAAALAGRLPTLWMLLWGSFFALFPDADIVKPILLRRPMEGDHHLTWWHCPFTLITATAAAWWFIGLDVFWLVVAVASLLWHYIHDTWTGGIGWLRPFNNRWFGVRSLEPHSQWLERIWLRPSTRGGVEILAGSVALFLNGLILVVPKAPVLGTVVTMTPVLTVALVVFFVWPTTARLRRAQGPSHAQ